MSWKFQAGSGHQLLKTLITNCVHAPFLGSQAPYLRDLPRRALYTSDATNLFRSPEPHRRCFCAFSKRTSNFLCCRGRKGSFMPRLIPTMTNPSTHLSFHATSSRNVTWSLPFRNNHGNLKRTIFPDPYTGEPRITFPTLGPLKYWRKTNSVGNGSRTPTFFFKRRHLSPTSQKRFAIARDPNAWQSGRTLGKSCMPWFKRGKSPTPAELLTAELHS